MHTRVYRLIGTWKPYRLVLLVFTAWLAANTPATAQVSYIKIVEGQSGNGQELGVKSLTTDQMLTVHAAGYDAGGTYLGDEIVLWSVTGGIGTLNATIETKTTLDVHKVGSGVIIARHAAARGDTSGIITANPGVPHHVKVLSGVSGATSEFGNSTLVSGQLLIFHAGSFDADDNYIADVSVNWSVSGGIGTLSATTGLTTIFTATTAGVGMITADHASLIDDATGTITVRPGPVNYVKVVEGASGNGPQLGARSLTTDQTLTVHAAGYDAGGNYVGDQTVTWNVSGGIGTLAPAMGTSTTLDAKRPGIGVITADHATVNDDTSGTITVLPGLPHRMKILAGLSGATSEVGDTTLVSGQNLAVHAGGFDADSNYIADISVAWSVSGGIGNLTPTMGVSTIFTASKLGSGVIAADHPTLRDDTTGTITVVAGALHYVKIVQGSAGDGPELGAKNLTTDDTLQVHAAGYDFIGNYLGDQTVTWGVTGGIGTFTPAMGTSTKLDATTPGIGLITADHATAIDDASGTITVTLGVPYRVKILTGSIGATSEVGNVALVSGGILIVHASSFDRDSNYISDADVSWRVSGGIGTLSTVQGISTVFTATTTGSGFITADHPTLVDDETGVITVNTTEPSYVKIVEGAAGNGPELGAKALTTDQTLTVHAAGYDANGNYTGEQTVVWSVSGGIGMLSSTTGTTTTLDARTPGAGFITADHPVLRDDVSGAITVTVGAPHHVKILHGISGAAPEVGVVTVIKDTTLVVHASSFDADSNRISDVSVDWSVSGGIGTLNPSSGMATTFTATNTGRGVITAKHSTLISAITGTIIVLLRTSVSSDPALAGGAPPDFQLLQNYPNPFHAGVAATRINYELPAASLVKIAVYNLNGQLLRGLFEGRQSAGRHAVSWEGQTASGELVASGVYLVRLEADKFVATRKIVVAR